MSSTLSYIIEGHGISCRHQVLDTMIKSAGIEDLLAQLQGSVPESLTAALLGATALGGVQGIRRMMASEKDREEGRAPSIANGVLLGALLGGGGRLGYDALRKMQEAGAASTGGLSQRERDFTPAGRDARANSIPTASQAGDRGWSPMDPDPTASQAGDRGWSPMERPAPAAAPKNETVAKDINPNRVTRGFAGGGRDQFASTKELPAHMRGDPALNRKKIDRRDWHEVDGLTPTYAKQHPGMLAARLQERGRLRKFQEAQGDFPLSVPTAAEATNSAASMLEALLKRNLARR